MTFTFKRSTFFLFLLTFSFLLPCALHAAPPKEALLIANGKYSHFAGLAHPESDAAKLGSALKQLGFRVRVVRDGSREQMLDAIAEFERGLRNTGAIAFFHYGGHGVQVDGKNYLLPADADIPDERRVATRAVALDEVMTAMDAAAARASIIVIDACRDNPLPAGSGRNLARGLSVVGMKPKNSIVIYAAEAGSKALDGLFTPILAVALQQKGRTIDQVMKSVRSEVYAKSSGQQTPGEYNQLFEELFLGEPAGDDLSAEKVFAVTPAPTPHATPAPLAKDDMVFVEGGTLPDASELAGKSVKSFYIGRTEVTWLEWKKVRNWAADHGYDIGNVGEGSGNDHPVRNVNWFDCVKWCNARSEMEGLGPVYTLNGRTYKFGESAPKVNKESNGYRLPTEGEWEWAARGGVKSRGFKYSGSNDLKVVGWFKGNSGELTHAVCQKQPNELGIYDMSGNIYEWSSNLTSGLQGLEGGAYGHEEKFSQVSYRGQNQPAGLRSRDIGLRLARNATTIVSALNAAPTPESLNKDDMVFVEGGTLPDASELAGKSVKSFFIGRTEVTWLEWKKVRGWASDHGYDIGNVGEGSGNDHPVRNVNWYDCVKWCNARSEMEGLEPVYQVKGKPYRSGEDGYRRKAIPKTSLLLGTAYTAEEYGYRDSSLVPQNASANGYRLPSELEWEWAARGGVKSQVLKYSGSDDLIEVGWYRKNSDEGTEVVGTKARNELGLHDMSGNVWEWCEDAPYASCRRIRGGGWGSFAEDCSVSYDAYQNTDCRSNSIGFRLARSP